MGLSVFGSAPAGLTPFDPGRGGDNDFRLAEHVGSAVIVKVQGPEEVKTSYGLKTAVKCDVVVLDKGLDGKGTVYSDCLIFNAAPVDQIKGLAGQMIVATVGTYETKQGSQAPRFEAPTPEVIAAAEKFEAASK